MISALKLARGRSNSLGLMPQRSDCKDSFLDGLGHDDRYRLPGRISGRSRHPEPAGNGSTGNDGFDESPPDGSPDHHQP